MQLPKFYFQIPENTPPPFLVGQVSATDADSGRNSHIKYKIHPGTSGSTNFALYPNGGIVALVKFDREKLGTYVFHVEASDSGKLPLSESATVKIKIIDVNDCAPTFSVTSYDVAVDENMLHGTEIVQVKAEDHDLNENSKLSYQLNSNQSHVIQLIKVDRQSGVVIARGW